MVKVPLPLNASTKRKHKTQAQNATTKHKHKTQALMGATRLASGKMQCSYTTKQRLTNSTNYTQVCEPLP